MKKLLLTAVLVVTTVSAWAQGTVTFANYNTGTTPQILARTTQPDGTTFLDSGFAADLYYGTVGTDPSTWTSAGVVSVYRAAAAAGRLTAQEVALPGRAGGTQVGVQLRAWRLSDGATWAAANSTIGAMASPVTAPTVVVTLGNPSAVPPTLGANLIDVNSGLALVGHSLVIVPEPSTILLGLAGLGGLFFLRRKMA
jgi:hypothetical protein